MEQYKLYPEGGAGSLLYGYTFTHFGAMLADVRACYGRDCYRVSL